MTNSSISKKDMFSLGFLLDFGGVFNCLKEFRHTSIPQLHVLLRAGVFAQIR